MCLYRCVKVSLTKNPGVELIDVNIIEGCRAMVVGVGL